MRMGINPSRQRSQKKYTKTISMEPEDFLHIFPDAKQFKSKSSATPLDGQVQLRTLYQMRYKSAKELTELFGKNWFVTRHRNSVGLFVGEVKFSLRVKTIHNFASICDWDNQDEEIDQETSCVESLPYLYISYRFTNFAYDHDKSQPKGLWRQEAEKIMNRSISQ